MSLTRSADRASRWFTRSWGTSLLIFGVLLVPSLAHAQSVAGNGSRCVRRRAARRVGRGRQPGADRKDALGHHRQHRAVPHHRSDTGHLHADVHAAELRHRQARGARTERRRGRLGQRRDARRRASGNRHRERRGACRRRADQHEEADRAEQRGARGAALVAWIREPDFDRAGHPAEPGRQRHQSEDDLLHRARRPRQRGDGAGGQHERRRRLQRRRRVRVRLSHPDRVGSAGHGDGRSGRSRSRRTGVQHHSQDRRQHVQRPGISQLRRRLGAGQQPRRHAARPSASPTCPS